MSIAIMTAAWKTLLPSTQKLVLLALADNANDTGECYPSMSNIAAKCSLSERAVQKAVGTLEEGGYLERDYRNGRSTVYRITPDSWPETKIGDDDHTPERRSPRTTFTPHEIHPEPRSPRTTFTQPPNDVHPTPERGAPRSVIEPSSNQSANAREGTGNVPTVSGDESLPSGLLNVLSAAGWSHRVLFDPKTLPMVRGWERNGVTEKQVKDAIAIAVSRCNGLPNRPTYLAGIVDDICEGRTDATHQRARRPSLAERASAARREFEAAEQEPHG